MASLAVSRSCYVSVCGMEGQWRAPTHLMVIAEQFVEEVNRFIANEALILSIDKCVPALLWESAQDIIVLSIELNVILVEVVEQVFSAEHFGDFDQLVAIAIAVEEWLFPENHTREHGS